MKFPWTNEEIEKLKQIAKDHTYEELSEIFGKPAHCIRNKCRSLLLGKGNPKQSTQNERHHIARSVKEIGIKKTALKYNLTPTQVYKIIWREKQLRQSISSQVPALNAEKLRKKAIGFARKNNCASHADDFASYCVVRLYEGSGSGDLKYLLIDYKRLTFGGYRSQLGTLKANARLTQVEIGDEDIEGRVDPGKEDTQVKVYEMLSSLKLEGMQRACLILSVLYGLTQTDIAFCVGLTPSRVCQILENAEKKIKE